MVPRTATVGLSTNDVNAYNEMLAAVATNSIDHCKNVAAALAQFAITPEQAAQAVHEAAGLHDGHDPAPQAQDPRHAQAQLHRRRRALQCRVPHRADGAAAYPIEDGGPDHPRPDPCHCHKKPPLSLYV